MQANIPNSRNEISQLIQGLCSAFTEEVTIYWLHPSNGSIAPEPFTLGKHKVIPVPLASNNNIQFNGHSEWIQDPFVILKSRILIPVQANEIDWEIARRLAMHANLLIQPVNIRFEGGNIFTLGDHLLLGKDILLQNGINPPPSRNNEKTKSLKILLKKVFAVNQITWLGNQAPLNISSFNHFGQKASYQPFFHLDLFLLPLGTNGSGQPQFALASLENEFLHGFDDDNQADLQQIREALDSTETQIKRAFGSLAEVIRIPCLLMLAGKILRLMSHCNGHCEKGYNGRRVLLPDFEPGLHGSQLMKGLIRKLQSRVKELFTQKGIQAHFIAGDYFRKANNCGALHCETQIVQRKEK